MDFDKHFIITTVVLLLVELISRTDLLPSGAIISLIVFSDTPDQDQKMKYFAHRNMLWHSIVPFIPAMIAAYTIPVFAAFISGLIFVIGIHLVCDIKFGKKGSMQCISAFGHRLNHVNSNLWLLGNFIASLVLFIVFVW